MRYGTTMMTATILSALLAATPFAAGAAESKMDEVKDKAKSKMDEVKDKAKSATEGAKTAVSDSWITSKTKIALFADERVKRLSTDMQLKKVDVRADGGVVTLTGEVTSITASAKASEMARNVAGVKLVKNELTVRQAGSR